MDYNVHMHVKNVKFESLQIEIMTPLKSTKKNKLFFLFFNNYWKNIDINFKKIIILKVLSEVILFIQNICKKILTISNVEKRFCAYNTTILKPAR